MDNSIELSSEMADSNDTYCIVLEQVDLINWMIDLHDPEIATAASVVLDKKLS